jgi:hypothetical protein
VRRVEGQSAELPLKVCPHCSVASRTDADTCPSCGKPYVRQRPQLRWSWWLAIPIVAAAFAIGYFGISKLFDDDGTESGVITSEQAQDVPANLSRSDLEESLGEPAQEITPKGAETTCLFYSVSDQGDTLWQFCFQGDDQVSSSPVPG